VVTVAVLDTVTIDVLNGLLDEVLNNDPEFESHDDLDDDLEDDPDAEPQDNSDNKPENDPDVVFDDL
jgi:hypothetical protein